MDRKRNCLSRVMGDVQQSCSRRASPALATVLSRVHYAELPTIYPLDAVAVFLSCLSLLLALWAKSRNTPWRALGGMTLASVVLGLAVGAKLYPVILAPLFLITWFSRFGWRWVLVQVILFTAIVSVVLWPLISRTDSRIPEQSPELSTTSDLPSVPSNEPIRDGGRITVAPQQSRSGLEAFLSSWEMNDFLFLVLVENVKPATAAFLLTRLVTSIVFIVLALMVALRAASATDPIVWLRAAFLTVAWCWLLSPTPNPWYWTWAMPLVAFSRSKAWLAVSGLALIYYLRFWLAYHWPVEPVLGTGYRGNLFFDHVVTWLEFAPWLGWLALSWYNQHRK